MNARPFRAKREGQSLPIIALIIVVLFGMVALSVDVGNTYAENRSAVRATNAASLAGMDTLIRNGNDVAVATSIQASFESNGIKAQLDPTKTLAAGERRILAYYLDSNGNPLPLGAPCQIGRCSSVPQNVTYIQLKTEGTVDTYFARVVGRPTLPVNAQAFAAQCSPVKGVYPIGINANNLDLQAGKFLPPTDPSEAAYYGTYYDTQYQQGLSQRRIYRKTNFDTPGSFSWMQWQSGANQGNAVNTANMLTLDGNLDLGFDEVTPWPDPNSAEPTGYPLLPHQLSEGDWIYDNTGSTNSSAVNAALDYHVAKRTVLTLPIIDKAVGNGQNTRFHVLRMGSFYLRGYNTSGNGYFDLVYLGEASKTACLNTNVNLGLAGLGLAGQLYVNPRWQEAQPPHQPIAYQIVLDVSGSMSWDFNGYGTYNNRDVQCESPSNPNPLNLSYNSNCNGGVNAYWKNQNERRIYVAKQAIYNFIDSMGQYDMMRVVAFSTDESGNASASSAWSSNKTTLHSVIQNAGKYNNNEYRTSGGTPGPQALDKASKMFLSSNGYTPTAPNGQDYKPVVIYLTDGVANIFLNGSPNYARDICGDISSSEALNTASPCQIGRTAGGTLRPISAMVDIANNMKASIGGLEVYVVGLAQAPSNGLPQVATDSAHFFSAEQGVDVQNILDKIQDQVTGATCIAAGGYTWVNSIDSAHLPPSPPAPAADVFGKVYIYEQGNNTPKYTLDIQHDGGQLGFRLPPPDPSNPSSTGITPGVYEMSANIWYKGDDGNTRSYDYFIDQGTLTGSNRIAFSVSPAATLGSTVPLPPGFLDLSPNKVVCPKNP